MERTIRIKGTGKAKTRPDTVEIPMVVEGSGQKYEDAVEMAAQFVNVLRGRLEKVGFPAEALKTVSYDIDEETRSEKDKHGNYKTIFVGFRCTHRLKLELDFDSGRLGETLNAVASSGVNPDLRVKFLVKNREGVVAEMLRTAAIDANVKALVLCNALGVKLGKLLSIDYSWGEIDLYSHTNYECDDYICCESAPVYSSMAIEPEDVETEDTVTFIWEIE